MDGAGGWEVLSVKERGQEKGRGGRDSHRDMGGYEGEGSIGKLNGKARLDGGQYGMAAYNVWT